MLYRLYKRGKYQSFLHESQYSQKKTNFSISEFISYSKVPWPIRRPIVCNMFFVKFDSR